MSGWLGINLIVGVTVTAAAVLLTGGAVDGAAVAAAGLSLVVGSELIRHGVTAALHRADMDEQKVGLG